MEKKQYPAHINRDGDSIRVQTVPEHLEGVAELASGFAQSFHAEKDARRAGMLHDIGKFSQEFVTHITNPDRAMQVDHSTAGAQAAGGICPIAFAVAGHHGGLPDGGNPRVDTGEASTLAGRLKRKNLPDASAWENYVKIPSGDAPKFCQTSDKYVLQFYTRMLFSCLVDGDYLDTERFMEPDRQRPKPDSLEALDRKLTSYVQRFYPPQGELNRLRCEILDCCGQGGRLERGLYSLTVPTGGGKTLASLLFALRHGAAHHMDRVIYVAPYTSIIDQTADLYREILGAEQVLEHHSGVIYDDTEKDQNLALAAENWDMPVIVTTAVQFFESLYANRPSRCRKLHNISNAVIVFDEAQSIPNPTLLPCVAAIAELVRHYGATALLCTATQPALDDCFLAYALPIKELCPNRSQVFQQLRRTELTRAGLLTQEELAEQLSALPQVLCVVNKRKTAAELSKQLPSKGTFCLTTLLYPAHRKRLLREIRRRLKAGEVCRVVSTSLIEAGVDVDFPRAFREEAGLDSILQTAGRCNREGKQPAAQSLVTVFSLEERPMQTLAQQVDATKRIWGLYERLDTPEAIAEYFQLFRDLRGKESLDAYGILSAFERGINGCWYPFAQVAQRMRLIDSPTRTLYLPLEEGAELTAALRRGEVSRTLFRALGQYAVALYPNQFQELESRGAVYILPSGDGILEYPALYDPVFGLQTDAEIDTCYFI